MNDIWLVKIAYKDFSNKYTGLKTQEWKLNGRDRQADYVLIDSGNVAVGSHSSDIPIFEASLEDLHSFYIVRI